MKLFQRAIFALAACGLFIYLAGSHLAATTNPKAPAKPNYTGTWKLDLETSKNGDGTPMSSSYKSFTMTIDHQEPALSIKQEIAVPAIRTVNFSVTTDGIEHKIKINTLSAVAWSKWEGDSLKTYLKRNLIADESPIQRETIRTLTLSPDGKRLTASVKVTELPNGTPTTGNEVWIKQ